jgi:thymidylate synthase (FAD)
MRRSNNMKVKYIDHMGDDLSVVNSARVSFGKKSDYMPRVHMGEAKVLQHKDEKLIKYLAKHNHKSPFNHAFATFHVKAPIFVARQLQKHEYMPWNEISRRYVDSEPELYYPSNDVWRGRSEDKKQGSEGEIDLDKAPDNLLGDLIEGNEWQRKLYKDLLKAGVAPEQARMVLPQSMYTEWYWSGTLYAFAKMCSLRLKEDTQLETREIAKQISDEMAILFPVSWEALL